MRESAVAIDQPIGHAPPRAWRIDEEMQRLCSAETAETIEQTDGLGQFYLYARLCQKTGGRRRFVDAQGMKNGGPDVRRIAAAVTAHSSGGETAYGPGQGAAPTGDICFSDQSLRQRRRAGK